MTDLHSALLATIRAYPGGQPAMAEALGYKSLAALRNRLYEIKGQQISLTEAVDMMHLSKTSILAETIAELAGGVFVPLPDTDEIENQELLFITQELAAEVGAMSGELREYIRNDGQIDLTESHALRNASHRLFAIVQQLIVIAVRIYGTAEAQGEINAARRK